MKATLYGIPASHPVFAAALMLERKSIDYKRVDLPQWFHRTILRPVDGALELPDGPGLGIELDEAKIDDRREAGFED